MAKRKASPSDKRKDKKAKSVDVSEPREVVPSVIAVPFEARATTHGESQAILATEIEIEPPTKSMFGEFVIDLSVEADGDVLSETKPREVVGNDVGTGISDLVQGVDELIVREVAKNAEEGTVVRDPV